MCRANDFVDFLMPPGPGQSPKHRGTEPPSGDKEANSALTVMCEESLFVPSWIRNQFPGRLGGSVG